MTDAVCEKPDLSNLPAHVAIIMDGNGRWAKERGFNRSKGHSQGLEVAKKITAHAADMGIKYLTLYAFSTENWKRTEQEVGYLMGLIKNHLRAEFNFYKSHEIRIEHLGNLAGLPDDIQEEITKAKEETTHFTGLTVVLAINYGGRDEITRGIKKIIDSKTKSEDLNEDNVSSFFDIPSLPDCDLLIRTGGEKRLSNFLLWQASYSEFIFSDKLWPDYNEDDFDKNIVEFQKRTRRFGAVLNN